MSRSERYEHPESVGKSKTAGLKLQFSHARGKLRVVMWETRTWRLWLCRTTEGNLITSAGAYFPCSLGCKMQWVLVPSVIPWKNLPPSRKIYSSHVLKGYQWLRFIFGFSAHGGLLPEMSVPLPGQECFEHPEGKHANSTFPGMQGAGRGLPRWYTEAM